MSKKNTELAKKIVDQLGKVTKSEASDDYFVNFEAGVLPYEGLPYAATKKAAVSAGIERIASDLDDGSLVLSDTWAEDNLQ